MMRLVGIRIENFKSIKSQYLDLDTKVKGRAFTLIGINESGKSAVLQGIALMNGEKSPIFPDDFHNPANPIQVVFTYKTDDKSLSLIRNKLIEKGAATKIANQVKIEEYTLSVSFSPNQSPVLSRELKLTKVKSMPPLSRYNVVNGLLIEKSDTDIKEYEHNKKQVLSVNNSAFQTYIEENLLREFTELSHKVTFWKSEDRYLIDSDLGINDFANNPTAISIPLKNCFDLSGIPDIAGRIAIVKGNPSQKHELQEVLSDKVTKHINKIWPGHEIRVEFQVEENTISFLIMDKGVPYVNRRVQQRSDGFRQFISFLLTISAENSVGSLSNNILLLDEPETHIHPQGQKDLLRELISIAENERNNIVIFATHSSYMIDKENIQRCKRVVKKSDGITEIEEVLDNQEELMSYAKVNYEVFNVISSDYHSEIYGYLHGKHIEEDDSDSKRQTITHFDREVLSKVKKCKKKTWVRFNGLVDENVSLSTYIRNCNNHPEAAKKHKQKYTEKELEESIEFLESLKKEKGFETKLGKTSK